jgi:hypothetical protein
MQFVAAAGETNVDMELRGQRGGRKGALPVSRPPTCPPADVHCTLLRHIAFFRDVWDGLSQCETMAPVALVHMKCA